MELESYFDFLPDGDIRIRGTRVYLEDVIRYYYEGESPEGIHDHFSTVTVEQAYATILYYLANRADMDAYIKRMEEEAEQRYQEYMKHPSEFHLSLKKRVDALRKQKGEVSQPTEPESVEITR